MKSYRLAEPKYAFFSRTERETKKMPRSLFLWMVFKHGLLEGSTILLQHSAITRTPLESSRLGELNYAISLEYEVRPKNKSIRKCKKMTLRDERTWSLYCEQIWTGLDRCEQVRTGVKYYFSSTMSRMLSKFGLPPKPACSFLTAPRSKLHDLPKWWKQHFVTLQLA